MLLTSLAKASFPTPDSVPIARVCTPACSSVPFSLVANVANRVKLAYRFLKVLAGMALNCFRTIFLPDNPNPPLWEPRECQPPLQMA